MKPKKLTDKQKLKKIIDMITDEMMDIRDANENDSEYNSLDGNGCSGFEAWLAFEPIYSRVMKIMLSQATFWCYNTSQYRNRSS